MACLLNCSQQFVRAANGFPQSYSQYKNSREFDYPVMVVYRSLFIAFGPGGWLRSTASVASSTLSRVSTVLIGSR